MSQCTNLSSKNFILRATDTLVLLFVSGLLLLANTGSGYGLQNMDKLNRLVQSSSSSDAAAKTFREGRDLIADEKWSKAADKFNEVISKHPTSQNVDAALYWLAFSLKKQNKLQEADKTLDRLIKEYASSNWVNDARSMRVELASLLGKGELVDEAARNAEDDEIKLVALQSLFSANPERATAMTVNLLKPDSKASRRVKEGAITLLGQRGGPQGAAILMDVARQESDLKLRTTAISWLGRNKSDEVSNFLKDLAINATDRKVVEAAAYAIFQQGTPRTRELLVELAKNVKSTELRRQAIYWLGNVSGEEAVEDLIKLYDAEQSVEIKREILSALSRRKSQRAQDKIVEIARSTETLEIRREAISLISRRSADQSFEILSQLYDAEKSLEIKRELVHWFGRSGKQGLQKLMQVAKSDASVELRKEAIFWLGQSKDPDAMKFLEEILK
jgi:HEAT repeat protein